jgi:hypothetical protein
VEALGPSQILSLQLLDLDLQRASWNTVSVDMYTLVAIRTRLGPS